MIEIERIATMPTVTGESVIPPGYCKCADQHNVEVHPPLTSPCIQGKHTPSNLCALYQPIPKTTQPIIISKNLT